MRLGSWTVDPHGITSAFPDGISTSTRGPVRSATEGALGRGPAGVGQRRAGTDTDAGRPRGWVL